MLPETINQKYSILSTEKNKIKMIHSLNTANSKTRLGHTTTSCIYINYLQKPLLLIDQIQFKSKTSNSALRIKETMKYTQFFSPPQKDLRIKTLSFDKNIFKDNQVYLSEISDKQTIDGKSSRKRTIKSHKIGSLFENYNQVKQNVRLGSRHFERFILPRCMVGKYSYAHLSCEDVMQLHPLSPNFKLVILNYLLNSPDSLENKLISIKSLIKVCDEQEEMEKVAIFLNQQLLQLFERLEKMKQYQS